MNALLLDTCGDKYYLGDTYLDLAQATGRVSFDLEARTCTIQHSSHPHLAVYPTSRTLSWGESWTRDEMLHDMARDAVRYLCMKCGFKLYRAD